MQQEHVHLEPLSESHIPALYAAMGSDPEIYRWLPFHAPQNEEEFAAVIRKYLSDVDSGVRVSYAVILNSTNMPIGSTSFLDLNPAHKSVEIGSTMYAKQYWRSFVNTETKLLMLSLAFDERGCERVTIKTDSMNQRSRDAILRLGATFEGILRHHMLRPDGTWRDSAYFSILREEWPSVKERLENKLASYA